MSRKLRRVPLDFDHPIGKVWPGYVPPALPGCPTCDGDGMTAEARAIHDTFYRHQIDGPNAEALAWHDKLTQADVDALIAAGRLPEGSLAADVNVWERTGMGHDCLNRNILIRHRWKVLGVEVACAVCGGHGSIATDEERAANDDWQPTDPPTGEGFQLWETVTEGSPNSPVFSTLDELCVYAERNCSTFGSQRTTAEQWKQMLETDMVVTATTTASGGSCLMI